MKNILLIGTGRFGRHTAVQLSQLGHQIMAVDTNEDRINDVLPYVTNAQIGDQMHKRSLLICSVFPHQHQAQHCLRSGYPLR